MGIWAVNVCASVGGGFVWDELEGILSDLVVFGRLEGRSRQSG